MTNDFDFFFNSHVFIDAKEVHAETIFLFNWENSFFFHQAHSGHLRKIESSSNRSYSLKIRRDTETLRCPQVWCGVRSVILPSFIEPL